METQPEAVSDIKPPARCATFAPRQKSQCLENSKWWTTTTEKLVYFIFFRVLMDRIHSEEGEKSHSETCVNFKWAHKSSLGFSTFQMELACSVFRGTARVATCVPHLRNREYILHYKQWLLATGVWCFLLSVLAFSLFTLRWKRALC